MEKDIRRLDGKTTSTVAIRGTEKEEGTDLVPVPDLSFECDRDKPT
jgi:hypothetical protein